MVIFHKCLHLGLQFKKRNQAVPKPQIKIKKLINFFKYPQQTKLLHFILGLKFPQVLLIISEYSKTYFNIVKGKINV